MDGVEEGDKLDGEGGEGGEEEAVEDGGPVGEGGAK